MRVALFVTVAVFLALSQPAYGGSMMRALVDSFYGSPDLSAHPKEWNLEAINHENDLHVESAYSAFASAHGKEYESDRVEIFRDNLKFIKEKNSEQSSYKLGLNRFADLSYDEFKKMYLAPGLGPKLKEVRGKYGVEVESAVEEAKLPDSVDWVAKGAVGPARDQGECGSCWAFATVGAAEGAHFIATGELVELSPQELMSCDKGDNDGCDGGFADVAMDYIIEHHIETEEEYPYQCLDGPRSKTCREANKVCDKKGKVGDRAVTSYVSADSEEEVLSALAEHGPGAVVINAGKILQHYTSGVIDDPKCSDDIDDGNHLVLATGYTKDTISIRNSWGDDWGDNGFFLVAKNKNMCGVGNDATFPTKGE